jgi:hypothetical protein
MKKPAVFERASCFYSYDTRYEDNRTPVVVATSIIISVSIPVLELYDSPSTHAGRLIPYENAA